MDTGLSFPNGIRANETDLLIRTLCAISSSSHPRGSEHYGKVKPWWAKVGIDSLITPKHPGWALKEMTGLFATNSAAQGREITLAVTLLYVQPNVHSSSQAPHRFAARRTDMLRGVTAYGISKFVKSTRQSWMGSAFFFPPLIVSVLIPKMNRRGARLSPNPIMPRGALKSSTETRWEHFLSLNGSRNTCIMNSLHRIGVMRKTPLVDNKAQRM